MECFIEREYCHCVIHAVDLFSFHFCSVIAAAHVPLLNKELNEVENCDSNAVCLFPRLFHHAISTPEVM